MNVGWLLDPVTQDSMIALGMLGSLALWIAAKVESRSNHKALRALRECSEGSIRDLDAKLDAVRIRAEHAPAALPAAGIGVLTAPGAQGMNLTMRTRALRMHRRGESASTIAAALQLQREEVELLLKLDQLLDPGATR